MFIWGIRGNLGEGKTSCASILAHYFKFLALTDGIDIQLFSNYGLLDSEPISTYEDFYKVACCRHGAIVVLDEGQGSLDSRNFSSKTNIYWSQFSFYLRKLGGGTTLIITTPDLDNIDVRFRRIMNIFIDCRKGKSKFHYDFYDYQAKRFLKTLSLPFYRAREIFSAGLYNTDTIVTAVKFPSNDREFEDFLNNLKQIQEAV